MQVEGQTVRWLPPSAGETLRAALACAGSYAESLGGLWIGNLPRFAPE